MQEVETGECKYQRGEREGKKGKVKGVMEGGQREEEGLRRKNEGVINGRRKQ